MKIALVSGDGLPVSGLLTVFRNVFDLGRRMDLVDPHVVADLGYSWRPDKPMYFPYGDGTFEDPDWMAVVANAHVGGLDRVELDAELTSIRRHMVAAPSPSTTEGLDLRSRIDRLAALYRRHFLGWFEEHQPDWVFALNMTLSDAVPVTAALHRAGQEFFLDRPGGIVFWDHDLFESCSIWDADADARAYPVRPNAFTPVPMGSPFTRWVVVSDALAQEAGRYPSDIVPDVVTNILPAIPSGIDSRHRQFAEDLNLSPRRPIVINPVRVFRVKGVEIAVRLVAAMREQAAHEDEVPYLLVFGSLDEDPAYAAEILDLAGALGVESDIRFLDGVPLRSYQEADGRWRLDEIDLIRLAAYFHGATAFTPAVSDVETVGLPPGLGAVADLPCFVTDYAAFAEFYADGFTSTRIGRGDDDIRGAARECLAVLERSRSEDADLAATLARNRELMAARFPEDPWIDMLRQLSGALQRDEWGDFTTQRAG